jgi:hypothetical protein
MPTRSNLNDLVPLVSECVGRGRTRFETAAFLAKEFGLDDVEIVRLIELAGPLAWRAVHGRPAAIA